MAVNAGYTMVPKEIHTSEITPQAKALFGILYCYLSADSPFVWPSRKALADAMGMSRTKSVDRYLTELEDAGFMRREYRPNQSAVYELVRWENGVPFTRFRISGSPTAPQPSPLQRTRWSPTEPNVVPCRGHELDLLTKTTNKIHLTICETSDLGKCDLDPPDAFARRAAGQCEKTIDASICGKQDDGESSAPASVDAEPEAETKDAGDGEGQKIQDSIDAEPVIDHAVEEPIILELPVSNVDTESLIATAPDDMNEHEEAALRAAKFCWDPYGKTWVDMTMFG